MRENGQKKVAKLASEVRQNVLGEESVLGVESVLKERVWERRECFWKLVLGEEEEKGA